MIRFLNIHATDTFAYKELDFSFQDGIHSIAGLNGASKSSILLALCQGLYNRNPKGGKVEQVSNTVTGNPYSISITFDKDGVVYTVVNSRKAGKITIERDGTDISCKGIPASLKLVEEIIGMPYDTFVNLVYQSSKSTLDLVEEAGDASRKQFIGKVLKYAELDKLHEKFKALVKETNAEIKAKLDVKNSLQDSLIGLKEVGEQENTAELESLLAGKESLLHELTTTKAKIAVEVSSLTATMNTATDAAVVQDRAAKITDALGKFRSNYASLDDAMDEAERLNADYRVLVSKDNVCPFCSGYFLWRWRLYSFKPK